jgi:hypothetical protein
MAEAEGVGQPAQSKEGWMADAVRQQRSPADDVNQGDGAVAGGQADSLAAIESPQEPLNHRRQNHPPRSKINAYWLPKAPYTQLHLSRKCAIRRAVARAPAGVRPGW